MALIQDGTDIGSALRQRHALCHSKWIMSGIPAWECGVLEEGGWIVEFSMVVPPRAVPAL
jgi:hypothetical protein